MKTADVWIGERVKRLQAERWISQDGLAKKVGVVQSAISKVDRGLVAYPGDMLLAGVAEALNDLVGDGRLTPAAPLVAASESRAAEASSRLTGIFGCWRGLQESLGTGSTRSKVSAAISGVPTDEVEWIISEMRALPAKTWSRSIEQMFNFTDQVDTRRDAAVADSTQKIGIMA